MISSKAQKCAYFHKVDVAICVHTAIHMQTRCHITRFIFRAIFFSLIAKLFHRTFCAFQIYDSSEESINREKEINISVILIKEQMDSFKFDL